ncbi:Gamma-aminobutyric acid type B receptor subunit 1 [Collichthys lucidus]|uniref:Gamma-aminobutyric acid type B receptor subunit 1 n=1 Tax=Collichthys lucidus TaxID=240159 RepID=A0A4U5VLH0_COLLU|nr:Gamma-aminobutyric acid type B receptor subunit 1 [Collichthys lucidus]
MATLFFGKIKNKDIIIHGSALGCAIIRPPRDGGIRYRGLTQEQIRSVQVLPVDYEIEYICRGNRVIVGPKVRKCLPNGTWTDLSQHSRCLLLCPRVWTSLENGRVSSWPLGPPVEGTVLHYSCLPGFILMGRNSTQCNKMGKWDMPKPVCHYDRHYKVPLPPAESSMLPGSGDTLSSCLILMKSQHRLLSSDNRARQGGVRVRGNSGTKYPQLQPGERL